MKPTLALLLVASTCWIASCSRSTDPVARGHASFDPDILATVNGHAIRLADFEAELEHRARGRINAFTSPEDRKALLREMITVESIHLRAKEADFDQRPDIARQIKRFIVQRFSEERLPDDAALPAVSDTEVARFYQTHTGRFATPERVRFAVIRFGYSHKATEERKAAVIRHAGEVLDEARGASAVHRDFGALAQRHSEHQPTRYRGGDAGWISRDEGFHWPPEVIDAVFALEHPGELGPVVVTSNGCYLVKSIDRKPAGHRPLGEVQEALRYQLAVEQRDRIQREFQETMRADLTIEINHALLESIPAPPSPSIAASPPALPGS